MRHFLIPVLLLSLVAGCSSVKIGPHRIDVQQGNALDQENVARLKPGLNRSQVRFLLGTPLLVDPFRTDRWDYVYVYYKAGKLAEQKRISLFFEGDTLVRIEGDLPAPAMQPAAEPAPESQSTPAATPALAVAATTPSEPVTQPAPAAPVPVPVVAPADESPARAAPATVDAPVAQPSAETSVVPPLTSPNNVPTYVDPRAPAELSLQSETDVAKIQPDAVPSFSGGGPAAGSDAPVIEAVNAWATAWARRDRTAYFAAYDERFVPQGGISRTEWEARKRQALDAAGDIEVKIDSARVEWTGAGAAVVTFNQSYRSSVYSDAVIKQLRMVEQKGRWLIVEETVLSVLRGARP